ncbi:diiron oxygenase [Allosphingosinicella deserti]|uniref:DUF455 domain-containing protein n=1 Tax=Allosphingosinicella deserti TaxID=2116704 RepID=A0A2P7QY92_9SPHN|nr:diiron oxygenase [Sphingomonas deserti]PSJ42940.1 hypothetical protein C7I55_00530 [Sphingomonas deserti]
MHRTFTYDAILASSQRAAWRIEDVIPDGAALDFKRPFLPEPLARTSAAPGLAENERLALNHVRAHEYLSMFGLVEEFILPFILDHVRADLRLDDDRIRALLQFAGEEAKHIQLFRRFHQAFARDFGTDCAMIGPSEAISAKVLSHHPLGVALFILQLEWMTQAHYLGSIRDDADLDPLMKSLLRHHWMEEAQHARLDTLMVEAMAERLSANEIAQAFGDYVSIIRFMDDGLAAQAGLNLGALEDACGLRLGESERAALQAQQHQSSRWTFLGSGMAHPRFQATLAHIAPAARAQLDEISSLFH